MFEIIWQEINNKGEIKTKRKSFKTKEAMETYVDKLTEKDSFYRMLSYSGDDE